MVLGRPGQPFYVTGGRRVYFEPDGDRVAALVREPAWEPEGRLPELRLDEEQEPSRAAAPRLAQLRALQEASAPGVPVRRGLVVIDRGKLAVARDGLAPELDRLLVRLPEVLDAGPLIRPLQGRARQFLSRLIEVVVEPGVTREALEALVRPLPVHVYHQDRHDPLLFRLESDGIPGPEYGRLPEEIAGLPGIRSAESMIRVPRTAERIV